MKFETRQWRVTPLSLMRARVQPEAEDEVRQVPVVVTAGRAEDPVDEAVVVVVAEFVSLQNERSATVVKEFSQIRIHRTGCDVSSVARLNMTAALTMMRWVATLSGGVLSARLGCQSPGPGDGPLS